MVPATAVEVVEKEGGGGVVPAREEGVLAAEVTLLPDASALFVFPEASPSVAMFSAGLAAIDEAGLCLPPQLINQGERARASNIV